MARSNKAKKQAPQIEETVIDPVVEATETTEAATEEVDGKKKVEDIKLSDAQAKAYEDKKTVSAQIRYLNSEGFGRSAIAKFLGKRYQHVRNVLETPLKRQA